MSDTTKRDRVCAVLFNVALDEKKFGADTV